MRKNKSPNSEKWMDWRKKNSNQKKETLVDSALTSRRKVFDSFLFSFYFRLCLCFGSIRCQLKIIVSGFLFQGVFVCLFLLHIFTLCAIQSGQYNQQSRTNNFSLFISFSLNSLNFLFLSVLFSTTPQPITLWLLSWAYRLCTTFA